jgi:hypothetical protein
VFLHLIARKKKRPEYHDIRNTFGGAMVHKG